MFKRKAKNTEPEEPKEPNRRLSYGKVVYPLKPPEIIESPNHFWLGSMDASYFVVDKAKVEKVGKFYLVTKTFLASDYEWIDEEIDTCPSMDRNPYFDD